MDYKQPGESIEVDPMIYGFAVMGIYLCAVLFGAAIFNRKYRQFVESMELVTEEMPG